MPVEMRDQLERAKGKRSAGQELLHRLQLSFNQDRENERVPSVRAIAFLISEIAEQIHYWLPSYWHTDPYLFRSFKLAVMKLLDALEPKGEIRVPPLMREVLKEPSNFPGEADLIKSIAQSPEAYADEAFKRVWSNFQMPRPRSKKWADAVRRFDTVDPDMPGIGSSVLRMQERTYYGMNDAKRDLVVRPRRRKS
jgi:hypothetical protein